jgi:hypothetical protein
MRKTEIISSKVRNNTRMATLPTLMQYSTGTPKQSNKARKINEWD